MAENTQECPNDNVAENELSVEQTQDDLNTLGKQTNESEVVQSVSINSGSSAVEKNGGNISTEFKNSTLVNSNFSVKTSSEVERKKEYENTSNNDNVENGGALKITEGEVKKERDANQMDIEFGKTCVDKEVELLDEGTSKAANAINSEFGDGENWELETQANPQKDFILKSEDAKEDNLDLAENFQHFQSDCADIVQNQESVTLDSPSQGQATPSQALQDFSQSLYHIKWTYWKSINTPIITQNENGPCPLIALINALILKRKISIPSMQEIVSANQLMEYLGDCILDQAPERLTEGARLNYEQNMADAIAIMSKLQTGLDVNVKFTGVADFEFTPECVVFDLLNMRLMHGWLVDPQNQEAVVAIGNLSYNQLVEKIIASKQEGADPDLLSAGLAAEAFLEQSATQLTYHGLCELNTQLGEEELCIFFRNNHFNTLYKHKNELFLLVTDQGFLTEDKVMWETLSNVEGDGYFVDANFRTLNPTSQAPAATVANTAAIAASPVAGISQEDQDYLVALTLQEEQSKSASRERGEREMAAAAVTMPTHPDPSSGMTSQEWSDLQLALHLQKEEQIQQQQMQQQQQLAQQQHQQQDSPSTANVTPRGSPSHAANPADLPPQQQRPQTAPPTQGSHTNNNEKCTIV